MHKKAVIRLSAMLAIPALLYSTASCLIQENGVLPMRERLRVATTTSLYDSGLWDSLEPIFEKKYCVEVDVLYAGTGIALEYGRRGDVDIIVVHDRTRELQFIADGYGVERVPFAYNYFLIVGPENDPAEIKGLTAEEAFAKLAGSGTFPFVSRGDDSGTHYKEKAIWESAGVKYEAVRTSGAWYIEAARGMGPTLLMASEKRAYTLTDLGTFLSYKGEIDLIPIVDKGNALLNVYSAIAVNPERNPGVNYEMAKNMVDFLISPEIQGLIGNYGAEKYGSPLFIPCAGVEPSEME